MRTNVHPGVRLLDLVSGDAEMIERRQIRSSAARIYESAVGGLIESAQRAALISEACENHVIGVCGLQPSACVDIGVVAVGHQSVVSQESVVKGVVLDNPGGCSAVLHVRS